jgi:hypothetical protein
MEKRSRRRTRDLVTQAASQGLSQNEIGCARISMMARNTNAPCKMRKTYQPVDATQAFGALWKVLSQQAINVLVRPALPRALRIAKIDVDFGRQRKATMIRKFLVRDLRGKSMKPRRYPDRPDRRCMGPTIGFLRWLVLCVLCICMERRASKGGVHNL